MRTIAIKDQITLTFPGLSGYLANLPVIQPLHPKDISVLDALSRIIIGQMLSRKAASTIIHRAKSLAAREDKCEIALLSEQEMRSCGISNSKAKAIKLFAEQYFNDEDRYENWRNLESARLFAEVNSQNIRPNFMAVVFKSLVSIDTLESTVCLQKVCSHLEMWSECLLWVEW